MVTGPEARILARLVTFPPSLESAWDVPRDICLPGLAEYLGVVRSALHNPNHNHSGASRQKHQRLQQKSCPRARAGPPCAGARLPRPRRDSSRRWSGRPHRRSPCARSARPSGWGPRITCRRRRAPCRRSAPCPSCPRVLWVRSGTGTGT